MLSAVPLVLFGGSVTTLGAGMAVEGWLVAEGHFLLFFPVESWFRDVGTFVEHTHRLFGVLVGLCAIATVVTTWRLDARRAARALSVIALLAVCGQGALGGFRVLEDSPSLAFLHGAVAQAVFALLFACAVYLSPRWRAEAAPRRRATRLPALAVATVGLVLAQSTLGAWYRHSLRPTPVEDAGARLWIHVAGAVLVFVAVTALARAVKRGAAHAAPGAAREALTRTARGMHALLGVQVLLGLLAWLGYRPDAIGPLEWGLSIAHVLCGALLLATCTAGAMWLRRAFAADGVPALEPSLGGAA